MNDSSNPQFVARAIVGSGYLISATILFVGLGVIFIGSPEPNNGGYVFATGIFLTMIFFYISGLKALGSVTREMME